MTRETLLKHSQHHNTHKISTMKKLNFKSVQVTDIDGTVKELDFSKEIGNLIFRTTKDLGELFRTVG